MSYWLGIDLGTTYCGAAITTDGVRAEMLSLDHSTPIAPSVIAVAPGEDAVIGAAAVRKARTNPSGVAREFKRRFGDTTPIVLDGRPYGADQLMVRIVKWIVERATAEQGEPPDAVTICHPANWGPYKRELLGDVATLSELPKPQFLTEPAAASWWYASQKRIAVGDTVGVYDLGGGTFDAVVLRSVTDGFELVGEPAGIERLGGIDLDDAVLHFVLNAAGVSVDELDQNDVTVIRQIAELRADCRDAKEALSSDTSTDVLVSVGGVNHQVRLTRTEFEDLARPLVESTISAFGQAVSQAGVANDELSAVLLVGGSSRVPLVAQMVGFATGRPVTADTQSKNSVALGAAIHAHRTDVGQVGEDHDRDQSESGRSEPVRDGAAADGAGPGVGPAEDSDPELPKPTPLTVAGVDRQKGKGGLIAAAVVLVAVGAVAAFVFRAGDSVDGAASSTTEPAPVTTVVTAPATQPPNTQTTITPTSTSAGVSGDAAAQPPRRSDGWVTGALADPHRSGDWRSDGPLATPSVAWRVDDPIGGAPVAAGGVVYASFQDDTLRALDAATGAEIWSRETGFGNRTPTVSEDAVFFIDQFDVVAVDRETGANEIFRVVPPSDLEVQSSPEAPTVVDGTMYVMYLSLDDGVWTGHMTVVDLDTGLIKWDWTETSGRAVLPVMVTDDAVVLVSESTMIVFEIETGEERWRSVLEGDLSPNNAMIAGDVLIVRDSRLRAFELTDGSQRWSVSDSSLQYAFSAGQVVTHSLDTRAIDSTTGSVTWSTRWSDGRLVSDAISIGNGTVFGHGSSTGALAAHDLETGTELWAIDHDDGFQPGIAPVVHGGILVGVEVDRQLVAFE